MLGEAVIVVVFALFGLSVIKAANKIAKYYKNVGSEEYCDEKQMNSYKRSLTEENLKVINSMGNW